MTIATLGAIGEVLLVGVVVEAGAAGVGAFVSGGACLVASSEWRAFCFLDGKHIHETR